MDSSLSIFGDGSLLPVNATIRDRLAHHSLMLAMGEQVDVPLTWTIGGGMAARTIFLAADTELDGRIHLLEHINVMSQGDITVVTEDGIKRLTGFNIFVAKPGTKRSGRTAENTIWTTFLRTDETDPDKIIDSCTVLDYEEYLKLQEN